MTRSPGTKISRIKVAMQRGMNSNNFDQSTSHNAIPEPDILLHLVKRAGWPSASFCEEGLESGRYMINLDNAVYSFQDTITTLSSGNSVSSVRKRKHPPRKLFSPSDRLPPSASKRTSIFDKPSPTSNRLTFPLPDNPQLISKPSILSITISKHKDTKSAIDAMEGLLNTISNLERFERCDPPLGDCSLSDGKAVCWVHSQFFTQIWDTTFGLDAKDLHSVTDRIEDYFRAGRIKVKEKANGMHFSNPIIPSDVRPQLHMYPSLISTFRKASITINMLVITRDLFEDVDPNRCTFKLGEMKNGIVKSVDNRGRTDGLFEFSAEEVGMEEIHFRIRSWKDGAVRLVGVQVQVKIETGPEEEDEELVKEAEVCA